MRHTRSSGGISNSALGHDDAFESLMKFTYIKYLTIIYCLQTISISDALPTSCEHLLELDSLFPDDYYWMTLISPESGVSMGSTIIYCHGMSSAEPKTFLPLPAGRKTNYASMSNLKSSRSFYCNFDLTYPEHGYTEYDMVRIVLANLLQVSIYKKGWAIAYFNIFIMLSGRSGFTRVTRDLSQWCLTCDDNEKTQLENVPLWKLNFFASSCFYPQGNIIIPDDYTYAHHVSGIKQPFGRGGDCIAGVSGCHKGNMTVNFTGTGFSLHHQVGVVSIKETETKERNT